MFVNPALQAQPVANGQAPNEGLLTIMPQQEFQNSLAAWQSWAQAGEPGEARANAVERLAAWCHAGNPRDELDFSGLGLTRLPAPLPERLQQLTAANNRLAVLPEQLPRDLRWLDVSSNALTALPEEMPGGLRTLWANHNQLADLPKQLPVPLREMSLTHNQFVELPATVDQLWGNCNINLNHNPLSPAAQAHVEAMQNSPRGPLIHIETNAA